MCKDYYVIRPLLSADLLAMSYMIGSSYSPFECQLEMQIQGGTLDEASSSVILFMWIDWAGCLSSIGSTTRSLRSLERPEAAAASRGVFGIFPQL